MAHRRWFSLFGIAVLVVAAGFTLWRVRFDGARPAAVASGPPDVAVNGPVGVTALGRIEPKDGLLHLAGPSDPSVVIQRLLVDKGDAVKRGQLIAVLDTYEIRRAKVARLEAELARAQADFDRNLELNLRGVLSEAIFDASKSKRDAVKAELSGARAALARSRVYSPVDGQIVDIHAHEGERVGLEGIAELARTGEMYAIAEVYETDVGRVKLGQRATVTSAVLPAPLLGTVERIHLKISKLDAIGADPIAKTDARVVEVEIRLDESAVAASLTNLQVEIRIEP